MWNSWNDIRGRIFSLKDLFFSDTVTVSLWMVIFLFTVQTTQEMRFFMMRYVFIPLLPFTITFCHVEIERYSKTRLRDAPATQYLRYNFDFIAVKCCFPRRYLVRAWQLWAWIRVQNRVDEWIDDDQVLHYDTPCTRDCFVSARGRIEYVSEVHEVQKIILNRCSHSPTYVSTSTNLMVA